MSSTVAAVDCGPCRSPAASRGRSSRRFAAIALDVAGRPALLHLRRDTSQVHVVAVDGTGDAAVTASTSNAIYANGHLLFMREDALLSQPFDLGRAGSAKPIAIAKGVQQIVGEPRGVFSASDTGLLLYQDGGAAAATSRPAVWFERERASRRRQSPTSAPPEDCSCRPTSGCRAQHTGRRVTPGLVAGQPGDARTDAPEFRHRPRRSLELRRVVARRARAAYSVRRDGKIFIARVGAGGGQEQRLFELPGDPGQGVARVSVWMRNPPAILYTSQSRGGMQRLFPIAPRPARRRRCLSAAISCSTGYNVQLAPNRRWIAFQAATPGTTNVASVFVATFPDGGRRQLVAERSSIPRFSADGKWLYFAHENQLQLAAITEVDGAMQIGPPRLLTPVIIRPRLLIRRREGWAHHRPGDERAFCATRPLTLVQNWLASLKYSGLPAVDRAETATGCNLHHRGRLPLDSAWRPPVDRLGPPAVRCWPSSEFFSARSLFPRRIEGSGRQPAPTANGRFSIPAATRC